MADETNKRKKWIIRWGKQTNPQEDVTFTESEPAAALFSQLRKNAPSSTTFSATRRVFGQFADEAKSELLASADKRAYKLWLNRVRSEDE